MDDLRSHICVGSLNSRVLDLASLLGFSLSSRGKKMQNHGGFATTCGEEKAPRNTDYQRRPDRCHWSSM